MQWIRNQWRKVKHLGSPTQLSAENAGINSADSLLAARELLERRKVEDAFSMLNRLKAARFRSENLDFLRAECFLKLGQSSSALESLKEELRYFPGNQPAANLLVELSERRDASSNSRPETDEFLQLYETVHAYTMVGKQRLSSLFNLAKEVCARGIAGNFVECGVAAGGSSALLASVINRYSREPRRLFAFDTFEGMPEPTSQDVHGGTQAEKTGWGSGTCSAPESSLLEACRKLGVSDVVAPVKGLFATTLPNWKHKIGPIAFLHMDGDWYSSTMDILTNLYGQIQSGGMVQIDDYGYWD